MVPGLGAASPWKSAEERQEERGQKRDAVLRVAARLFLECGVHRTTLSDVADRLNISKTALYHYFKNKNEILFECYRLGAETTQSEMDKAEVHCATGFEKIQAFIHVYVRVLTIDVGICVIMLDDRDLEDERRAQIHHWRRSINQRLKRYVEEGMHDGSVASCDANMVTHIISGAINGIGYWYRPEGRMTPLMIAEQMADHLTLPLRVNAQPLLGARARAG